MLLRRSRCSVARWATPMARSQHFARLLMMQSSGHPLFVGCSNVPVSCALDPRLCKPPSGFTVCPFQPPRLLCSPRRPHRPVRLNAFLSSRTPQSSLLMPELPASDIELAERTREALQYYFDRIDRPIPASSDHFAGYIAGFCPSHREWFRRHGVQVTMEDAEYVAAVVERLFVEAQLANGVTPEGAANAIVSFKRNVAPGLDSGNLSAEPFYAAAYAWGAHDGFGFDQQFGEWEDSGIIDRLREMAKVSDSNPGD